MCTLTKCINYFLLLILFSVAFLSINNFNTKAQADTAWNLHSFIWNERINIWARTSCDLVIAGRTEDVRPLEDCHNNTSLSSAIRLHLPSITKYDHDDGGVLKGRTWSPVYGPILFEEDKYDDITNDSCYGISGDDRQAKVVRVRDIGDSGIDRGDLVYTDAINGVETVRTQYKTVAIVGCAYAPLLRDFILLSPVHPKRFENTGSAPQTENTIPSPWEGVKVYVLENDESPVPLFNEDDIVGDYELGIDYPYLLILRCAWSEKSGSWSFGPNEATASQTNENDCLPSDENEALLRESDTAAIGFRDGAEAGEEEFNAEVVPASDSARVGQQIAYEFACPPGYTSASEVKLYNRGLDLITLFAGGSPPESEGREVPTDEIVKKSSNTSNILQDVGDYSILYRYAEILYSSVSAIRLVCVDKHEHKIFQAPKDNFSRGISVEALILQSFSVEPSIITEGGVVNFQAKINNLGDPNINGGFCTIVDSTSKKALSCFETESFRTTDIALDPDITSSDIAIRDTTYELRCYYDAEASGGPDADEDANYGTIDPCDGNFDEYRGSGWKSIGPFYSSVKVLPNRLVERNVAEIDKSIFSISKASANSEDDVKITISPEVFGSQVRIYLIDRRKEEESNKIIDYDNPEAIVTFFRDRAQANISTSNKCKDHGSDSIFTNCVKGVIYGTDEVSSPEKVVKLGEESHTFRDAIVSTIWGGGYVEGKYLIGDLYTEGGQRSYKFIYPEEEVLAIDSTYVTAQNLENLEVSSGNLNVNALVNQGNLGVRFPSSIAYLGDLNGDGKKTLALGGSQRSEIHTGGGNVKIANISSDNSELELLEEEIVWANHGVTLDDGDAFGESLANLGDFDGSGGNYIAIGAAKDDADQGNEGAVYIVKLNTDGTVNGNAIKIDDNTEGIEIPGNATFGSSVTSLGDIDNNGVDDLAIGAAGYNVKGGVYIVMFESNFNNGLTIKNVEIVTSADSNDSSAFGRSVANVGDLDGDGVNEIVIGADNQSSSKGAIYLASLFSSGRTKDITIVDDSGIGLAAGDHFGWSVANIGDVDGNGANDIAVGASWDGNRVGAVYVINLNQFGEITGTALRIDSPTDPEDDRFGTSISAAEDLNGDGLADFFISTDFVRKIVYLITTNGGSLPPVTSDVPPPITNQISSITIDNTTVEENTTRVGELDTVDPNSNDHTYTLVSGSRDSNLFAISNGNVLSFSTAPDFENPTDAYSGEGQSAGDNEYLATIETTNSLGHTSRGKVTVTVTDVDEGVDLTDPPGSGTISSNGQSITNIDDHAFDNDEETYWRSSSLAAVITYKFAGDEAHVLKEYTITSGPGDPAYAPKSWNVRGSNTGTGGSWTQFDWRGELGQEEVGIEDEGWTERRQKRTFTVENDTAYKYIRIRVLNTNAALQNNTTIGEIEFCDGPCPTE